MFDAQELMSDAQGGVGTEHPRCTERRPRVGVKNRLFMCIDILRDRLYRILIELGLSPPSKRRKGLSRDRKYPRGDPRTIFEGVGLAPHAEEDLTDKIFGAIGVRPKTDDEVVNAKVMPGIQRTHGGLVSCRNRFDEVFVGSPVVRMKICCLPAGQGMLGSHFPLAAPIRSGAPSAHTN
jgi:hypothetical protein